MDGFAWFMLGYVAGIIVTLGLGVYFTYKDGR